jgi:hypothetical protein
MAGFVVGFELSPENGIYLALYLGIAEVIFFNPEELEHDE